MNIQSINPATGEVLETFEEMSASEIDRILEANHKTFGEWRNRSFADRAKKCGKPPASCGPGKRNMRGPWLWR
jgi:acyl-CoA reductase-like NAD-dependent aldehyde dehydrogenase